jgi:hypothetical protein
MKEGDWPDTYQAREHARWKKKIVFFREFLSRARTLSRTKYEPLKWQQAHRHRHFTHQV